MSSGFGETKAKLLLGRYEQGRLLGAGSFASVYLARDMATGEEVAIKIMDKARMVKARAESLVVQEIAAMRRLHHPNVVRLHEVMATRSRIFLVMEYARGGALHRRVPHGGLPEARTRQLFQQLVSALAYCHAQGVYHRDIKPENLLLDGGGDLKVADFGLSATAVTTGADHRESQDQQHQDPLLHTNTVCGTPPYIAPEVFSRKGYDGGKADIWACGIVLFFLLYGIRPVHDNDMKKMYRLICTEYRRARCINPSIDRLVVGLLRTNPDNRMNIPKIMENRWFKRGFNEINLSIDDDDDDPELPDSDSDIVVSLQTSSGTPSLASSSPSPAASSPCGMRTSASEPSLTEVERAAATSNALAQPPLRRVKSLNAFDIIASSPSLNLSSLFEERGEEMWFVSRAPAPKIVSRLQEIAGEASFTTRTKEHRQNSEMIMRHNEKDTLAISVKISELSSEHVMVHVCRKVGNIAEYLKFFHNKLKPSLSGIIDDGLPEEGCKGAIEKAE